VSVEVAALHRLEGIAVDAADGLLHFEADAGDQAVVGLGGLVIAVLERVEDEGAVGVEVDGAAEVIERVDPVGHGRSLRLAERRGTTVGVGRGQLARALCAPGLLGTPVAERHVSKQQARFCSYRLMSTPNEPFGFARRFLRQSRYLKKNNVLHVAYSPLTHTSSDHVKR